MQRLVAIHFGNRDMVLELAWHGLVHLVQDAERGIARRDAPHDDAKAIDIRHLGKTQVFLFHLRCKDIEPNSKTYVIFKLRDLKSTYLVPYRRNFTKKGCIKFILLNF